MIFDHIYNTRIVPFHEFNKVAVLLINFIAVSLLFFVFRENKFRDSRGQVFLGMAFSLIFWVNFAYLARLYGHINHVSEFFIRIAWVATPWLFYFTYKISSVITEVNAKYYKLNKVIFFIVLVLSIFAGFSNLVIENVVLNIYLDIVYGKWFFVFLGAILFIMVATFIPLFKKSISPATKVFLYGLIIFYVFNMVFNISLPVFFNITHLYFLGDYSTIFLLGFTAVSIVQHQLFSIKTFATEVLTLMVWGILLSNIIVSEGGSERYLDIFILVLMIIFGILLTRSVRNEIKQREKLQELTEKLQAMDKQKDEFINMAAHELRAPMTAIKGYISMIMDGDAGEISEKARGYLTDVTSVNDRLVRLVNNMLNVSRIEEGRLVYKTEVVPLSDIAKNVYTSFKFEAERKGLTIEVITDKDIKDLVEVDSDKINEIIGNFVSNAVKYTETGSIEIKITQPAIDKVKLSVIDTGPGISKEEQDKLFQKFYRVQSTAGKTIGTGLGLYISKLLVEKFNGQMGLNSTVGKGSEFWFVLPVAKIQDSVSEKS